MEKPRSKIVTSSQTRLVLLTLLAFDEIYDLETCRIQTCLSPHQGYLSSLFPCLVIAVAGTCVLAIGSSYTCYYVDEGTTASLFIGTGRVKYKPLPS